MANKIVMTVSAKNDVLDITERKLKLNKDHNPKEIVAGQQYVVSVKSDAKYHNSSLPVNKVLIYNTTNQNPKGWFYIVEEGSPIVITAGSKGTDNNKVYAFFVDITSGDNTGQAIVTFEPVC